LSLYPFLRPLVLLGSQLSPIEIRLRVTRLEFGKEANSRVEGEVIDRETGKGVPSLLNVYVNSELYKKMVKTDLEGRTSLDFTFTESGSYTIDFVLYTPEAGIEGIAIFAPASSVTITVNSLELSAEDYYGRGLRVSTRVNGKSFTTPDTVLVPRVDYRMRLRVSYPVSVNRRSLYEVLVDGVSERVPELDLEIDRDIVIRARYLFRYTLEVSIEGEGTTEPRPGVYRIWEGEAVTLRAEEAELWTFDKWVVDTGEYREKEIGFDMLKDIVAKAIFLPPYILTVTKEGEGTTEPEVGRYRVKRGASLTLKATPAAGYEFSRWYVDTVEYPDPEIVVEALKNLYAKALFTVMPKVCPMPFEGLEVTEPGTYGSEVVMETPYSGYMYHSGAPDTRAEARSTQTYRYATLQGEYWFSGTNPTQGDIGLYFGHCSIARDGGDSRPAIRAGDRSRRIHFEHGHWYSFKIVWKPASLEVYVRGELVERAEHPERFYEETPIVFSLSNLPGIWSAIGSSMRIRGLQIIC